MGKESIKNGTKKVLKSHITQALLTGLAFGVASYYRTPDNYAGRELHDFNSTAPFNEQPIFGAHNSGAGTKEGTPFYAASQVRDIDTLFDAGVKAFEFDVQYGGEGIVTLAPTFAPSASPSAEPSASNAPSDMPSLLPTQSSSPSEAPSFSPSLTPTITAKPTSAPSLQPSSSPTISEPPTQIPSFSPTERPTVSEPPSESPSVSPTTSSAPSKEPSVSPSLSPTISSKPTISTEPSSSPSDEPTAMPTISSEPTITPVPTASFAPSMPPTVSSEPSLSPSISAAPTVTPTTGTPTPPTEEGYFIRHGAYSFLATNEPIDYKDTVEQFKSQVDKRNEVFVYKIDDFLLDSDAEKKQALKIAEDTFGNLVWDKKEQTDYATKNSGKWPSQDELLSMGKKIIIQNHHVGKTVPYDTSFFSTYGENEDRSTVADILRGIKTLGLPIPECIDPGPAVDKFSKKDAEKKAEQGGVTSYDDITKGDPRQFDRNLLAPEMWTVLEGVMRFNPETKAGNAAMFGFSSAYAAALGLAGAAMIANQTGGKKEKDTSDKSQKSNNDELSVQSGEVQEPENNKQNILVSTVDKASEFLSTVSKASLPLAAIGQAALKAGALFPDNRVLATGVAAGALGLKVASDVYWNKNKREINPENDGIVREKGVEPTADIVESQRTGRRGKRDKSLSDKVDIAEWTDRTKLAVALGVSAVLNVTGSEKHNTPFPVNVAATIVASSLAVDSLTNWKQRRSPDPSGDKQSLASMKLFSKLASASLIMAQNSSPDKEGAFVSGAIAMGMMAASNLPYYAVSKTVDYAAGKTKSFIDRYRDTKSASNSVGSIDPSNFLRDDGSSKISPESIHSDKSERGKGPIEI